MLIFRRKEKTVLPGANEIWSGPYRSDSGRYAAAERFDQRQTETFIFSREDEQIGSLQKLVDAIAFAAKSYALLKPVRPNELLEVIIAVVKG